MVSLGFSESVSGQTMVTAAAPTLSLNIPSESASDDNLAEWTGVS